jgi:hypothetical protein
MKMRKTHDLWNNGNEFANNKKRINHYKNMHTARKYILGNFHTSLVFILTVF